MRNFILYKINTNIASGSDMIMATFRCTERSYELTAPIEMRHVSDTSINMEIAYKTQTIGNHKLYYGASRPSKYKKTGIIEILVVDDVGMGRTDAYSLGISNSYFSHAVDDVILFYGPNIIIWDMIYREVTFFHALMPGQRINFHNIYMTDGSDGLFIFKSERNGECYDISINRKDVRKVCVGPSHEISGDVTTLATLMHNQRCKETSIASGSDSVSE